MRCKSKQLEHKWAGPSGTNMCMCVLGFPGGAGTARGEDIHISNHHDHMLNKATLDSNFQCQMSSAQIDQASKKTTLDPKTQWNDKQQ
jgi:hypothetical protein